MKNYPIYDVEHYRDLRSFVDRISEKYGDRTAICTYPPQGDPLKRTYKELRNDVYALGEDLIERGLHGKHMAIIAVNSYMMAVSILAVASVGGVAVPIDTEQPMDTIGAMVDFADCELVFISQDMLDVEESQKMLAGKQVIVLTDDPSQANGFHAVLQNGSALVAKNGSKMNLIGINPRQTAVIVYTSGTTSISKPVMLNHHAMLLNAVGAIELVPLPLKMFNSLPMYHAYGLICSLLAPLASGSELCINGDIRYMFRDFVQFKPNGMMVVPLIAEMVLKKLASFADPTSETSKGFAEFLKKISASGDKPAPELAAVKEKVLPGLVQMICGGAHLSPQVAIGLHKFGVFVVEGYGITECAPLISCNREGFFKRGTVGIPIVSYEVKIEDDEILARGECLMNGYYKQEELTKEAMEDGWFKTGDLGEIDGMGFITITGRKKNIIVLKNGKKVSPEELESAVMAIPLVKEALVFGSAVGNVADDVVPAVTIYPDPIETKGMSAYEILSELQTAMDAINENLPGFKQIRFINIREKEFPKTATKKIKRGK